jgi:hypothetical protein
MAYDKKNGEVFMMKRIIAFVFVLICIFQIAGCSLYNYDGWKTIHVDSCGTVKLPSEWLVYEKDGLLYVVDEEENPIMIQSKSYAGIKDDDMGQTEANEYFQEVTCVKTLSSAYYSNSAGYGVVLVEKNGVQSEQLFLDLGAYPYVQMIIWDDTVDEKLVKKIAKSFVIEQ